MSINKKSYLGTTPIECGLKDAIHVAIVSLRAGKTLEPGEHIKLNENREAVPSNPKDAFGVVNPYLTEKVIRGQIFWAQMKMEEIPNVKHHWEHPELSFEAPPPFEENKWLKQYADELGVTYNQFMKACSNKVNDGNSTTYEGTLSEDELDKAQNKLDSDLWYTWSDEVGYEFENVGSACCPEHDYPDRGLFYYVRK